MIKIFADGADKISILELNKNPLVRGFTTNPALMRKAGIRDYKPFALDILKHIKDKPISFEVFSDDWAEMKAQALEIASWGPNVYVKIPITNTGGWYCETLIEELNWQGVKINITAITTLGQVDFILKKLKYLRGVYISIFAGRIADTGVDPIPIINASLYLLKDTEIELIWASPREVFNIYQAEKCGCHIITCTPDLIKKYELLKGKDLKEYSRETVQMFYDQAKGYTL
ncbi:MAG TPA: transaldolase family protein [Bacteroidales bacterium]|nr:transaldolase family protein [Bacteroidales bacterium]